MLSRSIIVWNMKTGKNIALREVETIGDVRAEIEKNMDISPEEQILVGRTGQILIVEKSIVLKNQPGQTLLRENNFVLKTKPEMNVIEVYTKITTRRPVEIEIEIEGTLPRRKLTVLSDQTFGHLRMEMDSQLGVPKYQRRFTTLQTVLTNVEDRMCEYLLDPLPERSKQVIMVNELKPPPGYHDNPPPSPFNCCGNM